MFAKINHLAIASDVYAVNARFYQALFGMKAGDSNGRPSRAVPVSDGQVGLNNIPRRDGKRSGLDHFGFEVESMDAALDRLRKFDASFQYVQRPAARPNAAFSAHDPDMIIFDLAERNSGKAKDIFAAGGWEPARYIDHIALRVRNPERSAEFYARVFELEPANTAEGGIWRVSDGRVSLILLPWKMSGFEGQDPTPPQLEHFGFSVESVDAVKLEMEELIGVNPQFATKPLGYGEEGRARMKMFRQCPAGEFHLTDIEGVYVDVSAR